MSHNHVQRPMKLATPVALRRLARHLSSTSPAVCPHSRPFVHAHDIAGARQWTARAMGRARTRRRRRHRRPRGARPALRVIEAAAPAAGRRYLVKVGVRDR
eukprot:scaffold88662_cov54-Phaeocystis_antarctica.AAC.1